MRKLTAIIPCYNEEHHIAGALESVAFADEILVVDSFSTDQTVEIARAYASRILQHQYTTSARQKNWAIPQATHEWILLLDADERITTDLKEEIQHLLAGPIAEEILGFWIYRKNHFMGKEVHFSGWQNDKVIRLFRRDSCRYEDKLVHEEIQGDGRFSYLKSRIHHNTYRSIDEHVAKLNRYATWQAMEYDKITGTLTPYHFVVKPFWRFFRHYFIQQGFREGVVGFTISYLRSYSIFIRYVKVWLFRRDLK
ncbi:glycosyltransferase family 2 protein [Croceiramulus getboli]|nr:glycosyltransferase family 2 protein [Flavobacteriaceae bacterium YJPT1-3]